jgi:hypothetical protein
VVRVLVSVFKDMILVASMTLIIFLVIVLGL